MADIQRDAPLFDKLVPIEVSNGGDGIRMSSLTMRVLLGTRNNVGSNQPEKLFRVEITEESDPYFLYYLDIGELDFHHLKRDQSIRVEFSVFPGKLIELVEKCLASSRNVAGALSSAAESYEGPAVTNSESSLSAMGNYSSSYLARLDLHNGQLSVYEVNVFKELLHISLTLRPGNDAAIKAYLSSRLYYSLHESDRLRQEVAALKQLVLECKDENAALVANLAEARNYRDVDLQSLRSQHATELSQIRVSTMETLEAARVKHDTTVNDLRDQIEAIRTANQNRTDALDARILELSQDKSQLEYQVNDLSRKLSIAENSRTRANEDLAQMTKERRGIEEERSKLERESARLGAKVEALVQQVKDKDEMLAQAAAFSRATEDARASIEEKLLGTQANNDNLQERLKAGAAELVKGNQEIQRLMHESRETKERLRNKCEVIRRQEAVVQDLRSRVADVEKELQDTRDNLRTVTLENASLTKLVDEDKKKFEESVRVIANNKEIIAYLNDEISKWQLGMRVQGDVGMLQGYISPTKSSSLPDPMLGKPDYGTYDSSLPLGKELQSNNGDFSSYPNTSPDTVTAKYTPGSYSSTTRYRSTLPGNSTSSAYSMSKSSIQDTSPSRSFGTNSNNKPASLASSSGVPDKEILMQGVRNLGLSDSFGDLDALDVGLVGLDFDLDQGLGTFAADSSVRSRSQSSRAPIQPDLDLESSDYYTTQTLSSVSNTASRTQTYSNPYLRTHAR